jgi:two-component system LytT family sensor kinase
MNKTETRICLYSGLFIGLIMNSPKLLALRENSIVGQYWHFNLVELIVQIVINIGFCYLIFYANLRNGRLFSVYRENHEPLPFWSFNFLLMVGYYFLGGIIQRHIFAMSQIKGVYWSGYFGRFVLSALFSGIIIKLVLLLREGLAKDQENTQLKTAFLEAELQLLKEQVNPHFLFNSLSSLAGVVRETPEKAQGFISHLSKILRYALIHSNSQLVTVEDELAIVKSYEQLLKMRFEDAFVLCVNIPPEYLEAKVPHLSLQPLVENAAKHNMATPSKPLKVSIFTEDGKLVVSNNVQEIANPENSTGTGLNNLNSRYRILMHKDIEIEKNNDRFTVKLPLVV